MTKKHAKGQLRCTARICKVIIKGQDTNIEEESQDQS